MKATIIRSFLATEIPCFAFTFTVSTQVNAPTDESMILLEDFEIKHSNPRTLAAKVSKSIWFHCNERLKKALIAGNSGLQESALHRIIRYGAYLPADKATVFEVMKIYRNHDDDRMRRMAVIALGELEDAWAMGFLKQAVKFEQNERVAHTIKYVLKNYDGSYQ